MTDSLDHLHDRIDDLAAPDGDFYVACADTGRRPVPLKGTSFGSPDDAERAADLAREYREALREVDPYLDERRLAVYEDIGDVPTLDVSKASSVRERIARYRPRRNSRPRKSAVLTGATDREWIRMEGAPIVRIARDGEPLDDAAIALQLNAQV
ncbi:DUF7552 domain-containing protein [Halorussus amylolyticus]|uniref:DUF7552 domain-containing protein n=1 Tax=Halorussus amylolyticus TaxID=1126242 RepID=UPI001050D8F2|nr:hypothetical protein [Halorussus amylolyticus]